MPEGKPPCAFAIGVNGFRSAVAATINNRIKTFRDEGLSIGSSMLLVARRVALSRLALPLLILMPSLGQSELFRLSVLERSGQVRLQNYPIPNPLGANQRFPVLATLSRDRAVATRPRGCRRYGPPFQGN